VVLAGALPLTIVACGDDAPANEPGVSDEEDPGIDEEEQLDEDEPVGSESAEPSPLDEDE
jgi:hypothetical protein